MKTTVVRLTEKELQLITYALPMVGDREVEEETDPEERVGPQCDELGWRLSQVLEKTDWRKENV